MADTTTSAATYQKVNDEEYINKMYDSNLESQKQTLQQNYDTNVSNLDAEQEAAQKQTDTNLTRTYVEAAKAQKNYNEVQNAYGLTSGAMAQANLARNNQLQGDLTALRAAQQTADAEIERQRSLLAKEYASAIAQAQADNDLQRAQALYEAAKADEEQLLALQKEAGELMATKNDYSILAQLYGLTEEQLKLLQGSGGGSGDDGSSGSSGSSTSSKKASSDSTNLLKALVYDAVGGATTGSSSTYTNAVDSMWARNS